MHRPLFLVLAAAGALGAAGCGSSAGGAGTVGGPAEGRGDDAKELAFARCMRENGVNIPDPGAGGGPQRIRLGKGISPQVVERATTTCRDKTGGGPPELSEEDRAEFRDAALKFARCMRSNGVDVPDPQVGGGGGVILRKAPRAGGVNPGSPSFQRAEKACRDHLPGPRRESRGHR